jgi:hypothetical protein
MNRIFLKHKRKRHEIYSKNKLTIDDFYVELDQNTSLDDIVIDTSENKTYYLRYHRPCDSTSDHSKSSDSYYDRDYLVKFFNLVLRE